jgi:DNA-binding NarL/FixJ family response regulator
LANLVNQQPDLAIHGEAEEAGEALRAIQNRAPDIVVLDISLKNSTGLDLLKAVRATVPRCQVVVLSMHDEKLYAERCVRAGARGYVMKGESTRRIIAAIREVLEGRIWVSESIAASFAEKFASNRDMTSGSPLGGLSDRELEVFNLLGRGLETRQVAQSLQVSIKTVQAYCARIKQKLRLATAAELVREAIRWHEGQSTN